MLKRLGELSHREADWRGKVMWGASRQTDSRDETGQELPGPKGLVR